MNQNHKHICDAHKPKEMGIIPVYNSFGYNGICCGRQNHNDNGKKNHFT